MRFARIVLALVLTAVLLYVARTNSRGRPEQILHISNGYTFEMATIPKAYEKDTARITIHIQAPIGSEAMPVLRHAKFGQDETTQLYRYDTTPLEVADSANGRYEYLATAGLIGGKFLYYFQVRDNVGGLRAEFTNNGGPFVMKYIGHVPPWALVTHIFLMFATVFLVVVGALRGADLLQGRNEPRSMAKAYAAAVVCAFLGGYPFGIAMNWYTFGTVWEGVPFGTDATDNKTQLLFVYLVLVMLASLGSLTRGRFGRDIFTPKVLGWLGVLGFPVMLGIYLIPHSIQFAPGVTQLVCWSLIGLMGMVYVSGLGLSLKKTWHKGRRSEVVS